MPAIRMIKARTLTACRVDPNWSRWLRMIHELPEIRDDKVRRVRQALADHSFDADAGLDAALDRLKQDLDQLGRQDDDFDSSGSSVEA